MFVFACDQFEVVHKNLIWKDFDFPQSQIFQQDVKSTLRLRTP